jgi:hypothetical protein
MLKKKVTQMTGYSRGARVIAIPILIYSTLLYSLLILLVGTVFLSFSYVPLDVSGNTRLLSLYFHYITSDKCLSYTVYSVSKG